MNYSSDMKSQVLKTIEKEKISSLLLNTNVIIRIDTTIYQGNITALNKDTITID